MTKNMNEYNHILAERLMRYARIPSQSSRDSTTVPTTACQFDMARELQRELIKIGADDVYLDEATCVLYAKLHSNLPDGQGSPLGLVAHLDTSPDAKGFDVKPRLLENYRGGDIVLNKELGIVMRESEFPNLKNYIGNDLVLTDGTTLLGGDDKAAIAAIITFVEHLIKHPEIKHGLISLAFTPDEEVGGLAKDLSLERFGVPTCYTIDGDYLGYYCDETFNASEADIVIHGFSVHPGTAKDKMKNAVDIAAEFMNLFPPEERPQTTEGRQGFYHMVAVSAEIEQARLALIIRDHDSKKFAAREKFVTDCAAKINRGHGEGTLELTIKETYRSMKEVTDRFPHLVENLRKAINMCGLEAKTEPFRGGTDGSALSWRGLPAPNLSAGYENAHGRFEYVPVQSMAKNVEILLCLAQLLVKEKTSL